MARLITALGKGPYKPAGYYLPARPEQVHETPYAPVATAALVGRISDAAVLVTPDARKNTWEGCRDALAEMQIPTQAVDIPLGATEDEIWQVFTALLDAVGTAEEVVLDVTYSLRHLPFVVLASLTYLTAFRRVRVRGIHYGAFEARGEGPVPIFDLAPLVVLTDWYHAMRGFDETGSTKQLGKALRDLKRQLFRRFGADPAFDQLRGALEGLGWSLPTALPLEAGLEAGRALDAIRRLLEAPSPIPIVSTILEPLRSILAKIGLPLMEAGKAGVTLGEAEVDRELRLAELFVVWGQADRALLVLREWVINRVLLASTGGGVKWLDFDAVRRSTERSLNALGERARVGEVSGAAQLGGRWKKIATMRNAVAHGGYQIRPVEEHREKVARLIQECREGSRDDAQWSTDLPGPRGRVLVTPLGLSPGVLFTALQGLRPDSGLVITSHDAGDLVSEASFQAGWQPEHISCYPVKDAHACFNEIGSLLEWPSLDFHGAGND